MLACAAQKMGIRPVVLAENSFAPAAQVCSDLVYGSVHDAQVLRWFFAQVDRVIFENEFVDCARLSETSTPFGVEFCPSLAVIAELQDKYQQKLLFQRLSLPAAEFKRLEFDQYTPELLQEVLESFGGQCVLKWARLGYDGKGVFVLSKSPESLLAGADFCRQAAKHNSSVYAEQWIGFKRELAIISVYSISGEMAFYPLVVSEQHDGICSRVCGPATAMGVSPQLEIRARRYAELIAKEVHLHGTFGIEFFESSSGDLLVNEIAPRVHNSGHYTQNASMTDQFENHIRATMGITLGSVSSAAGFAMLNILGPQQPAAQRSKAQWNCRLPLPGPRSHLHWYGKSEIRPGRKLGHINGSVDEIDHLESLLKELEQSRNSWILSMNSEMKSDCK
jgi:5-(carboxyamino)imidazole ribonucleotide synthase